LAVFIAVLTVTALHLAGSGGGSGCSVAEPVPTLTAQLAALGGFDQPYDPDNTPRLDALAIQAAGVTSHNLIGAKPAPPVAVTSADPNRPNALVIPLFESASSSNAGRLAGLVVFLRDCAGRAYFSRVWDFTSTAHPATSFPVVPEQAAARSLNTESPELEYTTSPAAPLWCRPATGRCIPAGPSYPA